MNKTQKSVGWENSKRLTGETHAFTREDVSH